MTRKLPLIIEQGPGPTSSSRSTRTTTLPAHRHASADHSPPVHWLPTILPAASLLNALRRVGAADQAKVLTNRLPAEGLFRLFREQANRQVLYKFGREPNGRAAPVWSWDDLN